MQDYHMENLSPRQQLWNQVLNDELSSLLMQMADMRKEITTSTTATKKKYYEKKMKKMVVHVRQALAAKSKFVGADPEVILERSAEDVRQLQE